MEIKIKINLEEIKRNKCNNKILLCYMIYIYRLYLCDYLPKNCFKMDNVNLPRFLYYFK